MAHLPGSLQLHDVRDVEKLACSVIDRRGTFLKGKMTPERDDRLVAFLVEETWRFAAERFDPSCPKCRAGDRRSCEACKGSGKGASFSKLAFEHMAKRLIDWARSEFGDSRYPNRPTLESIDLFDENSMDGEEGGRYTQPIPEPLQSRDDLTVSLAGMFPIEDLSPRLQWVMLELVAPLADEYSTREDLAELHGVSLSLLEQRIDELAGELQAAA